MPDDKDPNAPDLKHDDSIEAEAKRLGDYDLHPAITSITSKLGAFNLIRNARNKRQVEVQKIDEIGS